MIERTDLWTVIIPIKPLPAAKTRLVVDGHVSTPDLAFAFAQDVISAALACPVVARVLVVTTDSDVAEWATDHGCQTVDDRGVTGINEAVALAAARVDPPSAIAVLVGDLPCLTPRALAEVLEAAHDHPTAFLADADGTGTTMWMSRDPFTTPRFGLQSREAHRALGAADLAQTQDAAEWLPARRDIDTESDLAAALSLGVGAFTARALAAHR